MAYRVELAKSAESELEELYLWVIKRAPSQGATWTAMRLLTGISYPLRRTRIAVLGARSAPKRYCETSQGLCRDIKGRALGWFNGLERAILSLDQHAERCPVAPENIDPDSPIRVLHYGRRPHVYRAFFTIDAAAKIVRVLHVRRGARRSPAPEDLTS